MSYNDQATMNHNNKTPIAALPEGYRPVSEPSTVVRSKSAHTYITMSVQPPKPQPYMGNVNAVRADYFGERPENRVNAIIGVSPPGKQLIRSLSNPVMLPSQKIRFLNSPPIPGNGIFIQPTPLLHRQYIPPPNQNSPIISIQRSYSPQANLQKRITINNRPVSNMNVQMIASVRCEDL
jgi:hypothetical protein